jgi:hypothetical protein
MMSPIGPERPPHPCDSDISRPSTTALRKAYSITSSARASIVGGKSTPIALAVFRLIANVNLVPSCTRFNDAHRAEITSLVARYGVPAVYPFRYWAKLGGLLSYGVDQGDNFRRAAIYADRILKGEKPSELPVQAPVKYELVINLKTAKALGLVIPGSFLQRADEVIE